MNKTIYLAVCIDHRCDPGYEGFISLGDAIANVKKHCQEYLDGDEPLENFEEHIRGWEYYCRPREEDYGYVEKIKLNGE